MEISPQEALDCFASDDLIGIGMEADAVRRVLNPENVVTYAVSRTVAIDQPPADLFAAVEHCALAGDTTVCLGHTAAANLAQLEEVLASIRQRFPSLRIHAFSTTGILALAESSGLDAGEVLTRLRRAGLDSISGENLCGRPLSPGYATPEDWLGIHRLAHEAGIASTAGLVFGSGESSEDLVGHLYAIRALQAESSAENYSQTGRFTSFTLLPAAPGAQLEPPTAVEYLRTLAIARIVLDNIPSIESSCLAHGLKVTQMALRFGANDAGSLHSAAATKSPFTEEDLRRVIRDAGFTPVERDPLYRTLYLNN